MTLQNLLDFITVSEKLKRLLRHSWLSDGRQESVAEHSWRMALMVLVLKDTAQLNVNLGKVLEMVIIHDLPEAVAGDHWAWKKTNPNKTNQEREGLHSLTKNLEPKLKQHLIDVWEEFEANKTSEAQFVHALDKMEVIIQHNQADLKTWKPEEYEFTLYYGDKYVEFNQTLKALKDILRADTAKKIGKI